jgi:hypothetical protein
MNLTRLADLDDPNSPEPTAADRSGRSAPKFVMEVRAARGNAMRRAVASGRDIYAITAPLAIAS